jgi:3-methylcrotonyl-CoA carboxylase alpha subunit
LFERDCSLQRRHQKVIEEAPAPGMDEATREAVCAAAVRAAQAVNYEGAGTIEFIADASEGLKADRIWFMEMNTRLQVEHPVTEEITGQDLVEWQLRVASGEKLPKTQDELSINGHAIEARLYAEDPAKGFLPSVGRLQYFDLGVDGRIETGVEEGDSISPFYDPMIAKLVSSGADRGEAIGELADILDRIEVWPVRTNAGFLFNALSDQDFADERIDTGFIERKLDDLVPKGEHSESALVAAVQSLYPEPLMGFRVNAPANCSARMSVDGHEVTIDDVSTPPQEWPDMRYLPDARLVTERGQSFLVKSWRASASVGGGAADGVITAPMPGKVTSVEVAAGDKVAKGQRLLTLEAMKMEHGLVAPFDGVVAELAAEEGAQVSDGAVLVKVEPNPSP